MDTRRRIVGSRGHYELAERQLGRWSEDGKPGDGALFQSPQDRVIVAPAIRVRELTLEQAVAGDDAISATKP
jgi:hypothetical protein